MAGQFGIIGCGYVGTAAARHFGQVGLEVTGTTTSPSRLQELCGIVDQHPESSITKAGRFAAKPYSIWQPYGNDNI